MLSALPLLLALAAPQDDPAPAPAPDPARSRIEAGRAAREDGRLEKAARDFEAALEFRPFDPALLTDRLSVAAEGDERALWTQRLAEALATERGTYRLDGEAKRLAPSDKGIAAVVKARAAAFKELMGIASKAGRRGDPDDQVVAWWARRLALELAQVQPGLLEGRAPEDVDPRLRLGSEDDWIEAVRALESLWNRAGIEGDDSLVIEAARIAVGLRAQTGFQWLMDEPARKSRLQGQMANPGGKAQNALGLARERLRARQGRPWTLEELDQLLSDQGEAFTREHDSFGLPGVALSPREWYRCETDCGFETLRGVAETIERHHTRLVNFYGTDPFVGRQGLVRIVPEATGLESEGAGYYWVGGFQGGDVTTFRFSMGTIEGLGHGLTHELTHRFDGALFPGQPSWLVEGKAVWTGAAYGRSEEEEFVPNHVQPGTLRGVLGAGWTRESKLRELLSGDLEDYRANYTAGYALYVFLNTWVPSEFDEMPDEDEPRLFQHRLDAFMANARQGAGDRIAQFERWFCDGGEGRPEDLAGFVQEFRRFLEGFHPYEPAEWTKRYTTQVPGGGPDPLIYDEPTWVWSRGRHEPYFGDGQAAIAGILLDSNGDREGAARALHWGLANEGRMTLVEERLAGALEASGQEAAAWALDQQRAFPLYPAPGPAPKSLVKGKARLLTLIAALDAAAEEHRGKEWRTSALRFEADRDRLARWIGAPEVGPEAGGLAPTGWLARFPVEGDGWVEDLLVGHHTPQEPMSGNWFAATDGDLEVGRRKERSGTGQFQRADWGAAFVRGSRYELPGTWRLKTRVRFTSTSASGKIVVGWTRRDRAVTLSLSGAAGRPEDNRDADPVLDRISWKLSGGFERDGRLQGAEPGGGHKLKPPRSAFEVELLVDGASCTLFIDGERMGTYHLADGTPIEGYSGFAIGGGALRFEHPIVERLDRHRTLGVPGLDAPGLDLATGRTLSFEALEGRIVAGVPPRSQGTVALWIPCPPRLEGEPVDTHAIIRKAVAAAEDLARGALRADMTQGVAIVLPAILGEPDLGELEDRLRTLFAEELDDRTCAVPDLYRHPFDGQVPEGFDDVPDLGKRWVFFLDAAGVARFARPAYVLGAGFDPDFAHWLKVFRDYGRPPRDLSVPTRDLGEELEDSFDGSEATDDGAGG